MLVKGGFYMDQNSQQKEMNNSKNFITTTYQDDESHSILKYRISQELIRKIKRRNSDQYIAGDIVAVFSLKNSGNENIFRKDITNKDCKTYFLILCNKFERNYLICPLFTKSLLYSKEFQDYEVSLGIISDLEEAKLIYADVSRCHYVNKADFHNHVLDQIKVFQKNGKDFQLVRLDKERFKMVIKKFKSML